jgi:hypothetical protein
MQPQINVTLTGSNLGEVLTGARSLVATLEKATTTGKTAKRATRAIDEDDQLEMADDIEETEDTDTETEEVEEADFGAEDEDIEEAPPKKTAKGKTNGAAKITQKDVIRACKAYSEEHSRKDALKILAKFKVKSVNELTPDQYGPVIKAMKI